MDHAYIRTAVHAELAAAFAEAKRVLEDHASALKAVAGRLRTHGRIDGHEVERIIIDESTRMR